MSKKITLDGDYELINGLGAWAVSRERGVKIGTVRMIGKVLMYAWMIHKSFLGKPKVCWVPTDDVYNIAENLRNWIKS